MTEPILVADIGGTNARFAIAERTGGGPPMLRDFAQFSTGDFSRFEDALGAYLDQTSAHPKKACFAAAGPANGKTLKFTNSPWRLEKHELQKHFEIISLKIVNDFYALAVGVQNIDPAGCRRLLKGTALSGAPRIVMGPGTGFGQAIITPHDSGFTTTSTEGGHARFSPVTDEETRLCEEVARSRRPVTVEDLLSGPGVVRIYAALCAIGDHDVVFETAQSISEAAIASTDKIAARTIELFWTLSARVAGECVLTTGARGGVFLGGGILPRITGFFHEETFSAAFIDRRVMSHFVAATPVYLITAEDTSLIGAATLA
ncbi:MAG: glucokinase [Pseudomonadota bacterium]